MASAWIELIGEVMEVLPASRFKVRLVDMDVEVAGHMSGKMKLNKITIMEWDYVKIEVSEYDMSQWRIVYRFKEPPIEYTHPTPKQLPIEITEDPEII